jgi:flavin-dependent thymidylate synthase
MFTKHYDELDPAVKKYPKDADIALPVIVADVRAWRDILFERLYIADNVTNDPISWLVTVAVVFRMYNVIPEAFGDLVDGINKRIASFKVERQKADQQPRFAPIESLVLNKLTDEELDNPCLAKFLEKFFGEDFKVIVADAVDPSMTVTIVLNTDRAVTHEHVRHRRDVGYSQESQRYVNYAKKGYESLKFTCDPAKAPEGVEVGMYDGIVAEDEVGARVYEMSVTQSFAAYEKLIGMGYPPECARKVLPNACRTQIVVTWLLPIGFSNFMRWRTEKFAQYDIRLAADKILYQMLKMKHPFLTILGTRDLYHWFNWMKEQNIFDKAILDEIDSALAERSAVEEELMRQAKEAHEAEEARRMEQMKKMTEGDGVVVDDHTTKKLPSNAEPPAVVNVGHNDQSATPSEPVTERPATIQLEPKKDKSAEEHIGDVPC